ncbi:unnamed protein product [Cuscuta europaea]|uniref:MULE transposase domain-containing protein n=1 Tax=Cuscuta europaea TaxID=41803 RepID=A0A9P1E1G1_CUSEU|nr:unnamed protein product [Cuscuta europaea]
MLLVAVDRDGNTQMFLLAWDAMKGENHSSWEWFLSKLQISLESSSGEGYTLILDQQKEVGCNGFPLLSCNILYIFMRKKAEDFVHCCYKSEAYLRSYAGNIAPLKGERY